MLFQFDTISMFRLRYVIEAETEEQAKEKLQSYIDGECDLIEFSQKHLKEVPLENRTLSMYDYKNLFKPGEDNEYLDNWDEEGKLSLINKL
jgi:hypothetical protein